MKISHSSENLLILKASESGFWAALIVSILFVIAGGYMIFSRVSVVLGVIFIITGTAVLLLGRIYEYTFDKAKN